MGSHYRGAVADAEMGTDRSPVGALLLHGFTGTPRSMGPVADALVRAGIRVEVPLLPGHGTEPDDLERASFADWVEAAEVAYETLAASCLNVSVMGLSMGGALAATLALNHPEIGGAILVNPFLEPVDRAFDELLTAALRAGSTVLPSIGSDIANPDHPPTGGYDVTPIRALLSLVRGVGALAPRLGSLTCPVLLFTSCVDHVVPTTTGAYLEAVLSCPLERVMLERSHHVATLDYDCALIVRRTTEFLERLAP
jgi:carboxylesterase